MHVLREAVAGFEGGHNELARLTGIPQSTITRFINGADIRLSNASRFALYLGFTLNRDDPAKSAKKRPKQ
jgi:plasmid maintenance system antidote protein VapI